MRRGFGCQLGADAIERAAKMAVSGEVFIPRGYYRIARTIKLPFGVNICGASSIDRDIMV